MSEIAVNFSHDSNVCFKDNNGEYVILELERYFQERYFNLSEKTIEQQEIVLKELSSIILTYYGVECFNKCYYVEQSMTSGTKELFQKIFNTNSFIPVGHHKSHALGAYWQSPFNECLILSFDGGGWDDGKVHTFNVYKCIDVKLELLNSLPHNFCDAYTMLAWPISEIKKNGDKYEDSYLSMAGKLMGLSAYKNKVLQTIQFENFPKHIKDFFNGNINLLELNILCKKLQDESSLSYIDSSKDGLIQPFSYVFSNLAQLVFNELVLDSIKPYILKHRLPLIITGGGALNVVCNSYLKDNLGVQIYVPPNPSDCGLSLGAYLGYEKPKEKIDVTYNGFPFIYDSTEISPEINDLSIKDLAKEICNGKIVGIIEGNCEVGARALMHRSIVCDPSIPGIKDKLNSTIKFRESFRPFAPVVREEQAQELFNQTEPSPYMAFNTTLKDSSNLNKVSGCVHVDNTARIQTVNKEQNPFAHELLTEVNQINSIGVLLNTSLNIKGKPMITKLSDALEILETTELDALYFVDSKKIVRKQNG